MAGNSNREQAFGAARLTAFQEPRARLLFGSFLAKMRAFPREEIVTTDLLAILLRCRLWASCTTG